MEDTCVFCGQVIPEGRQACPVCMKKFDAAPNHFSLLPAQKKEYSSRHRKAFRPSFFDSLNAFFHFRKKEERNERKHHHHPTRN